MMLFSTSWTQPAALGKDHDAQRQVYPASSFCHAVAFALLSLEVSDRLTLRYRSVEKV